MKTRKCLFLNISFTYRNMVRMTVAMYSVLLVVNDSNNLNDLNDIPWLKSHELEVLNPRSVNNYLCTCYDCGVLCTVRDIMCQVCGSHTGFSLVWPHSRSQQTLMHCTHLRKCPEGFLYMYIWPIILKERSTRNRNRATHFSWTSRFVGFCNNLAFESAYVCVCP